MTISDYITEIDKQYRTGGATEHSYRPALKSLLDTILPHLTTINEPKRYECGAPDYLLLRDGIAIAFLEAKDFSLNISLSQPRDPRVKDQFERYKKSLNNIIFTDYLDFLLYEDGEFVDSVRIGELRGDRVVYLVENESRFVNLIERLGQAKPQRVSSSSKLAQIMAGKARLLADVIERALESDDNSELHNHLGSFRSSLIHEITPKEFADIYAQTIAYGMFAARLNDPTPEDFSRLEAAELIPKTNPFLRKIFHLIAGIDVDDRISWVVDDLVQIFSVTDVARVMGDYGQRTAQRDPMIHFYEDFLAAYNPALRKSRGVWYTPQPVVQYIVRAVDDILQRDFGLAMGLADTSKIKVEQSVVQSRDNRYKDNKKKELREYHRVQILDPATGTGTFLAEVVSTIYEKMSSMQGMWQGYVEEHLLPRLNGFELLMASYAMAHLKLDMLLSQTGYTAKTDRRLRVFLTNSLEDHHPDTGTLFVQALANEANEANRIKRDTPVMVVLGNPPYSGESTNKGEWIMGLMDSYKREPGGVQKLKERNPKMINDDYCKFIRLGQEFVDRNSEGVLAYINNHSFLDNLTFRGMRWNLMNSFDKIYIIDLHGNSKKKEVCPDGSKDENVFDIQQGVSINIFVKTKDGKAKGELAEVFHIDLYGKRQAKYDFLAEHSFAETPFVKLEPKAPMYFFVPRNTENEDVYNSYFGVTELFGVNSVGIVTSRDSFTIHHNENNVKTTIEEFLSLDDESARVRFDLGKDSRDWQVAYAKTDLKKNYPSIGTIAKISYRPFDDRYTFYTGNSRGYHSTPRADVMSHLLSGENVGLVLNKQVRLSSYFHVYISKKLVDLHILETANANPYIFPLYLYPTDSQINFEGAQRTPNLKPEIVEKIAKAIALEFEAEKSDNQQKFAPIDLLDYIYGVLHTPDYRKRYKEFLKTDFPRIPYPESSSEFWRITKIGSELRRTHLLEHIPKTEVSFPIAAADGGDTIIDNITTQEQPDGTLYVYINNTQYFAGVDPTAWKFYIGGYQPAQKWLKDRRGRSLKYQDVLHYCNMIAALKHTDILMKKL